MLLVLAAGPDRTCQCYPITDPLGQKKLQQAWSYFLSVQHPAIFAHRLNAYGVSLNDEDTFHRT